MGAMEWGYVGMIVWDRRGYVRGIVQHCMIMI